MITRIIGQVLPCHVRNRRQEAAGISQEQRPCPECKKRKRCEECVKSDSKSSYYCKNASNIYA